MNAINLTTTATDGLSAYLNNVSHANVPLKRVPQIKSNGWHRNSVGQLIKTFTNLHEANWLLGMCTDGMPLLLNFRQVSATPLLVLCGEGCGKTHHLQVLVDSSVQLSKHKELEVIVFSQNPSEWKNLQARSAKRHIRLIAFDWRDPAASQMIDKLILNAEKRLEQKGDKKDMMLMFDDLNGLLELEKDSQVNLRWLLEYGASVNIWSAASLNTDESNDFAFWVKAFNTTITGSVSRYRYTDSSIVGSSMVTSMLKPGDFSVRIGNRWMVYHLPMLGN